MLIRRCFVILRTVSMQQYSRFVHQHIAYGAAVLISALVLVVAATQGLCQMYPPGVAVVHVSATRLQIAVRPTFAFDTVARSDADYVNVTAAEAWKEYDAKQGATRLILEFPVSVPGPGLFSVKQSSSPSFTLNLPLLKPSNGGDTSVSPLTEPSIPVHVRYAGISRGEHKAIVRCVLAESFGLSTTVFPSITATLDVAYSPSLTLPAVRLTKESEVVQSSYALTPVAKVTVPSEGVYKLTAQQLRDAGLPTDANAAKTIKMYGWGGRELSEQVSPPLNELPVEQDIVVRTHADGSINEIIFYCGGISGWKWGKGGPSHYIHHYATQASYLLTTAGGEGRRSVIRDAASSPSTHRPLFVDGLAFNEEELIHPYSSGSGRKWFGRTVENNGALVLTTQLPGLLRNGAVRYTMNVAHKGTRQGTFTISENGVPVAEKLLIPVPEYMDMYSGRVKGSISASQIASDSRSVLRFEYKCQDRASSGYLDWVELVYPRGLIADGQTFSFFTDSTLEGVTEYSINGFGSSEIFAYDVTDPSKPQRVMNVAPPGGVFALREELKAGVVKRYFITSDVRNATISPLPTLSLRNRVVQDEIGDLVIITHPDLLASAHRYASYRASTSNLRVSVVTQDEIFNEFGYGMQDPTAIRDFIGYAYRNAPTRLRYVLLWGDGHFDYKNISTTAKSYVTTFQSLDPDDSSYGLFTHTTEDFFVRVDGNDAMPDVGIGRLPVTSNAIGDRLLEKVRRYESEASTDDWRVRIALVADDGATSNNQSDGDMHLRQSESLISNSVPSDLQPKKIYLVEYPTDNVARGKRKPAVTAEILSTVNTRGALFLNWIGHGNPRVWAHEFVFERETTPSRMTNFDKPFFLTAATCDFARFDMSEVQSGAEELVLLSQGGAVGVFSSARIVFSERNAALNEAFYRAMFTMDKDGRPKLIGDVLREVKQTFMGDNDEKFFLLGDPTLRLLIPDHNVVFTEINGIPITYSAMRSLKALERVTVTGYISSPSSTDIDASFDGVATISLLDGQRNMTVVDDDVRNTVNRFTLPGALLARGSFPVTKGRFTATFVIPKDISYSANPAELFGYAYSDDRRAARGVTKRLVVNGVAGEHGDDNNGPQIQVYVDSRNFVSGQVVRANPVLLVDLEDETGINATGVGVGHDIEASFNNGSRVEVLTESFTTSLNNPLAGTASKQIFGLPAGVHTVRVRAWDVYNNVNEASTIFRIAPADAGTVASWVMNYPNPFSRTTTIRYQHNVSKPFTADVRIYDMQGRQIASEQMNVRDMQTAEYVWDGSDDQGQQLGSGMYQCVVGILLDDGSATYVSGKLTLIR